MHELNASLDAYLDTVLKRQWDWGKTDCCCWGADWVLAATGKDPLARYRGQYGTAMQARRLIEANGGLLNMIENEMSPLGFARADHVEHGDIGILKSDPDANYGVAGCAVAIRCASWWLARGLTGAVGLMAPALVAWRVL